MKKLFDVLFALVASLVVGVEVTFLCFYFDQTGGGLLALAQFALVIGAIAFNVWMLWRLVKGTAMIGWMDDSPNVGVVVAVVLVAVPFLLSVYVSFMVPSGYLKLWAYRSNQETKRVVELLNWQSDAAESIASEKITSAVLTTGKVFAVRALIINDSIMKNKVVVNDGKRIVKAYAVSGYTPNLGDTVVVTEVVVRNGNNGLRNEEIVATKLN